MAFFDSGRAAQLEVVATDPGEPLSRSLRQSLLEHVVGPETQGSLSTGARVKVGTPTVTGGEVVNTRRVVAGMRAGFRNCYQRVLAEAPHYAGRLDVRLALDASGAVEAAKVTSSPQKNAAMVTCVEARSKAGQFDPPSGNRPATVVFEVILGP